MAETKLQLILGDGQFTDFIIKDLFKSTLILIFSDDYTDEIFVQTINDFRDKYSIRASFPLNVQIQLSLSVLSVYSCFFCRHGSEINFRLMSMINHDINQGSSGDLFMNFVITLKKFLPESRCRNLKKYLIILYYIQILEIYDSNRGKNINFNFKSSYQTNKCVQNLKNEICTESILKTSQLLLFLSENYNTHDLEYLFSVS